LSLGLSPEVKYTGNEVQTCIIWIMSEIDFKLVKTGNGYANDLAATAAKYTSDTNKAV